MTKFDKFIGETVLRIDNNDNYCLTFHCVSGNIYIMEHFQNCCEDVQIEDICGDLDDLIGSPILKATEDTNRDNPKSNDDESYTWTFYNITTQKGTVTIRWYGTSNGYYSEDVDFYLKKKLEDK